MSEYNREVGVASREDLTAHDGLTFLQGLIDGKFPVPPIADLIGFALTEVENGRAVFTATPEFKHYNPIGVVHGGFAATLLDSALGCAVHSTCVKGETYTTLELKVNLVRAITRDTGTVSAEAKIIHRGRNIATAEAHLRDAAGKLYAHATTTCMVFPPRG